MKHMQAMILILSFSSHALADEAQVKGRVVDSQGKPVPAVKVWMALPGSIAAQYDTVPFAEAATNATGEFVLKLPSDWRSIKHNDQGHPGIIAYHPDFNLTALAIHHSTRLPESTVTLKLQPKESASLVIWTDSSAPVTEGEASIEGIVVDVLANTAPGALLHNQDDFSKLRAHEAFAHARWESKHFLGLPKELREKLTSRIDQQGRLKWENLDEKQIAYFALTRPGKVIVKAMKSPYKLAESWSAGLVLPAEARIEGTVKAPKADLLRDLKLDLYSSGFRTRTLKEEQGKLTPKPSSDIFLTAQATAAVDANGRFSSTLVEGSAGLTPIVRENHLLTERQRRAMASITAAKPGVLDLEFKPTLLVRGKVQDQHGKPVAGARVSLGMRLTDNIQPTDEQGRYQFRAIPGECQFYSLQGKSIAPVSPRELFAYKCVVPENVAEFDLPTIKAPAWMQVHGELCNDEGEPCTGAITARWLANAGQKMTLQFQTVQSDPQGKFTLVHIDPRLDLVLKASNQDQATPEMLKVTADKLGKPVRLQMRSGQRTEGEGTVVSQGKPLAGVRISLWWRPPAEALKYTVPTPLHAPAVGQPIPIEDLPASTGTLPTIQMELPAPIMTDAAGKFRLPACLEGDGSYQLEVNAQGHVALRSPWTTIKPGAPHAFGQLELEVRRTLAGVVVDAQGKAVAQASLIYHDSQGKRRLTSDAQGKFEADLELRDDGYVIAQAPGYRTQGLWVKGSTLPFRLVLTGLDQQPTQAMKTLPPVLSLDERKKLFAEQIGPILKQAQTAKDDGTRYMAIRRIIGYDAAQALELLTQNPFQKTQFQSALQGDIARVLARKSLEEARTVADSIPEASIRANAYLDFVSQLAADQVAKKKELLAQGLAHARAETDSSKKLLYIGKIAVEYLDLGESELGTRLLRESVPAAEQLPTSGWGAFARGAFAESLVRIDPTLAEKLCDAIQDERERTRHLGNMAHLTAKQEPERAERLLNKGASATSNEFEYGRYAMRLCYRMASVDLPRSEAIASKMETYHMEKAQAYASMARALAVSQPKEAERLLRRAYQELAAKSRDNESDFTNIVDSATVAASFLPVAEMLDPRLVPEFFWQTLALRPDAVQAEGVPFAKNRPALGDCTLALFLARYDHHATRLLLEQHVTVMLQSTEADARCFFMATAIVSPRQLAPWLKQLQMKARAERYLDDALGVMLLDGEALWKAIHRILFLWYPDHVDL